MAPDADLTTAGIGRLAGILPDARLELIDGSRTWVMRDQPERTAQLIGRFARRTATTSPSEPNQPRASRR
jgi:pimeloyl-ACP methyl ester carboxylesterase